MTMTEPARRLYPSLAPTVNADEPFFLQKEELLNMQAALKTGSLLPTSDRQMIVSFYDDVTLEDLKDPAVYQRYVVHIIPFGPFWNVFSSIATYCTRFLVRVLPGYLELAQDIVAYSALVEQHYEEIDRLARQLLQARDGVERRPSLEQLQRLLQLMCDEVQPFVLKAEDIDQQTTQFAQDFERARATLEERKQLYGWHFDTSGGVRNNVEQAKQVQTEVGALNTAYQREVTQASIQPRYRWNEYLGVLPNSGDGQRASEGQRLTQEMERLKYAFYNAGLLAAGKAMMDIACNKSLLKVNATITDLRVTLPVLQKMQGLWSSLLQDILYLQRLLEESFDEALAVIIDANLREAIAHWNRLARQAERYLEIATIEVE